jgi:hypothetical protein
MADRRSLRKSLAKYLCHNAEGQGYNHPSTRRRDLAGFHTLFWMPGRRSERLERYAMMSARIIPFALLLAVSAAHAQGLPPGVGAPAPGGPPPMAPSGPPPARAGQPQQQMPPCFAEFVPLREAAEKEALKIRAASEKKQKMTQPEACAAFRALTAAEGKMVKFVKEKNVWCGIPVEALKQMQANLARTSKLRDQVCNAARPAGPAAPSLSDALGTTRIPDATSTHTGRGTLDTLTGGNPLAR